MPEETQGPPSPPNANRDEALKRLKELEERVKGAQEALRYGPWPWPCVLKARCSCSDAHASFYARSAPAHCSPSWHTIAHRAQFAHHAH